MGRSVTSSSGLPSIGDKEQVKEMNGWLIEKIK